MLAVVHARSSESTLQYHTPYIYEIVVYDINVGLIDFISALTQEFLQFEYIGIVTIVRCSDNGSLVIVRIPSSFD